MAYRGSRSVVCAASYEARRFGIRSAMPAVRAERLCPEAIFLPQDFHRYKAVSRAVRETLGRHTELIEPLSLDEAYLDITENKTGLPTATRVAQAVRQQIREELCLPASAGVVPNKFLVKIAWDWRKPNGLFVIQPKDVDAFLQPTPVGRIPGVGNVAEARLKQMGVERPSASFRPKQSRSSRAALAVTVCGCMSWLAALTTVRLSAIDCYGRSQPRARFSRTFLSPKPDR